jgi:hypothetical protein
MAVATKCLHQEASDCSKNLKTALHTNISIISRGDDELS